jgi:hypothetical protein
MDLLDPRVWPGWWCSYGGISGRRSGGLGACVVGPDLLELGNDKVVVMELSWRRKIGCRLLPVDLVVGGRGS